MKKNIYFHPFHIIFIKVIKYLNFSHYKLKKIMINTLITYLEYKYLVDKN